MRRISLILLFALCVLWSAPEDEVMPVLDAYKVALNTGNSELIKPFLADSFRYMGTDIPLSVSILEKMMSLAPYTISSFDEVRIKPKETAFIVEADATTAIFDVRDTLTIAFMMSKQTGVWRIMGIVEPEEKEISIHDGSPAAVSVPISIHEEAVFVEMQFSNGEMGKMVVHNAMPKTIIDGEFAEKLNMVDGCVDSLSLNGIMRTNFPLQVESIADLGIIGKGTVGVLGADFFDGFAILLDRKEEKMSLIEYGENGELSVSIERFGAALDASMKIPLLGSYPFDAVSADMGFGFEAPIAIDVSVPSIILFPDFFKDTSGLQMDEDMRKFISEHPGRIYTHKYIAVGEKRKNRINSKIESGEKFYGSQLPKGVAGIIGTSFFDVDKVLINSGANTLLIFE